MNPHTNSFSLNPTCYLSFQDFPGSKPLCESATKVGPGYLPGPVFFVFEKISSVTDTVVEKDEKKDDDAPAAAAAAEAVPEKSSEETSCQEVKEKDVVAEPAATTEAAAAEEPPKP